MSFYWKLKRDFSRYLIFTVVFMWSRKCKPSNVTEWTICHNAINRLIAHEKAKKSLNKKIKSVFSYLQVSWLTDIHWTTKQIIEYACSQWLINLQFIRCNFLLWYDLVLCILTLNLKNKHSHKELFYNWTINHLIQRSNKRKIISKHLNWNWSKMS